MPADSEYVQNEVQEMADQLEHERRRTGDATFKTLLREMWTIPGNRNRAIISILLMIFQQMTGVNAIVRTLTPSRYRRARREDANGGQCRIIMLLKSSLTSE